MKNLKSLDNLMRIATVQVCAPRVLSGRRNKRTGPPEKYFVLFFFISTPRWKM